MVLVLVAGVLLSDQAGAAEAETKPARTIAHIALSGSLPEGVGQSGVLADVSPRLHRIVERIDQAASDPKVKGVLVSSASPDIGRGRMEEIVAAAYAAGVLAIGWRHTAVGSVVLNADADASVTLTSDDELVVVG